MVIACIQFRVQGEDVTNHQGPSVENTDVE